MRYRACHFPAALLVLLLLLAAAPARLAAQVPPGDRVENALINGAIGGVSAAVGAALTGKNPWKALLPGFGGGVAVAAGRQVAGLGFGGSGLLGRQISAAGISVIHSAARDSLLLLVPLGPVTFSVRPRDYDGIHPRVNLLEVAAVLYYALDSETSFDPRATLLSGAPAFRMPTVSFQVGDGTAYGQMILGTIVLGAYDPDLFPHTRNDVVLAHESIHVLQLDYFNQVAGLPLERALLRRLFGGAPLTRYLDIGLLGPLSAMAFHSQVEYKRRPWEREAEVLTQGHRDKRSTGCIAGAGRRC
ncbi:MAG TPA: hypothetical protein VGR27_10130 [Longimicrobiaceae bacterium]|nr:hypothetical protein [Longimicrobiaceae bacterium]